MELDPNTTDCYAILTGLVTPRPIAWISTLGPTGVVNVAPFSFFNLISGIPPVVVFAPAQRPDGTAKDTLRNLQTCPEFVVNFVNEDLAAACNLTATALPPEASEADLARLELVPSRRIRPPRVAASPGHLECEVRQLIPLETATLVIANVRQIHILETVLTGGRPDPRKLRLVGRLGATDWCRTIDTFQLARPETLAAS